MEAAREAGAEAFRSVAAWTDALCEAREHATGKEREDLGMAVAGAILVMRDMVKVTTFAGHAPTTAAEFQDYGLMPPER